MVARRSRKKVQGREHPRVVGNTLEWWERGRLADGTLAVEEAFWALMGDRTVC